MKKIAFFIALLFFTGLSFARDFILPGNNDKPLPSPTPDPAPVSGFANYTETTANLNLEMIAVQGGTYTMGCTFEQGDDCYYNFEKPAHQVSVNSFYIGKYEVTQAQWQAVMGNNPSYFKGDNLPVEEVSRDDIQEFIQKLNRMQSQYTYRLPSEEEWEYAARGGNKSNSYKYSGSNNADSVAWYYRNSGETTHPVGTKSPNELGIYDMSGNVYEWCSSCWRSDYNASTDCFCHVFRGGSWNYLARNVRVSYRSFNTPFSRYFYLGFRLACSSNNDANDMVDALTRRSSEVEVKSDYYFISPGNNDKPLPSPTPDPAPVSGFANYTETVANLNLEMIAVQGGTYTMGCTSEQGSDCEDDEKPAHSVSVSSFYIGKYEVTQAQWKAVMSYNPSTFKGDNLPVEQVSWNNIQEFIQKLNRMQNQYTYRLPSEEEWEYAARGGNKSSNHKYSGSSNANYIAWDYDNSGNTTTHSVGTKSPNELGIYDMSGNVWEWCSNCWRSDYNASTDCSYRVFRGGSWDSNARFVRVSCRYYVAPDIRYYGLGFRLACNSN